jgi:hypothetical protein
MAFSDWWWVRWYRVNIRQNNDAPRLRFTNTAPFDDTPLGFFGEAVIDRQVKAGPTEHQMERSYATFQKVGRERARNSMRWKHRLTEWITWKVPLFRRFYNTNVNEATGALHRSVTDPRNGQKYLLTSRGRFTGRARRGWSRRSTILDRHTGQPIDPKLQTFLQNNGVFLGRNLWNYINQMGRILSEMRDVGTDNERECFRYVIMPHDNNSGPMEALEDGTELHVRAFNSNGQWVLANQELQNRLFTHGYAKYPHYSGDVMYFFNDAWARASSDLVTQRQLLEMQREAEFGRFATETAGRALQREDRNVHVYGLGGQGGPGAVPPGTAPVGPGGPGGPGPHGGPGGVGGWPPQPVPAATPYGPSGSQYSPLYATAHNGTGTAGYAARPTGTYGPRFTDGPALAEQLVDFISQNPNQAEPMVDLLNSLIGTVQATSGHNYSAPPSTVPWTPPPPHSHSWTEPHREPAGTAPNR